jgi:hypothetical protein
MSVSFKKIALGALATLTLGLSVATPASAQYWGGPGPYRGGNWGGGYNAGPAVAAGVLGGLALGAAAASAAQGPGYAPAPVAECWIERRPIVDEYGVVVGRRRVRVCD